MRTRFDTKTWEKIKKPREGSRIFIKRGKKRYYGTVDIVNYYRDSVDLSIIVDRVVDESKFKRVEKEFEEES